VLKLRNYVPVSSELERFMLESSRPVEEAAAILKDIVDEADKVVANFQEETDKINLVPEKENFDLKRNIEKKLKLLDIRTKKAIIRLREDESDSSSDSESSGSDSSDTDSS